MQVPIATRRFVFIPMDLQDLSVGLLQVPNKQWGFEETETKTIAFPISFESIKYVFLSKIYGPASGGADTVAYNFFRKSLTGVSFDYAYTRNWLAIGGKQPQWGASGYAVTFPIAFNVVYNVLSIPQTTASTSNAYWGRFYITALTKNGFNVSDTGAGSNRWIAIGSAQPQWGYGNSESTQTFPIKFTNSVIGIYGSKRAINYEYTFAATSITNTNFFMSTRNSEGNSRVIACNWLAIGQQQTK